MRTPRLDIRESSNSVTHVLATSKYARTGLQLDMCKLSFYSNELGQVYCTCALSVLLSTGGANQTRREGAEQKTGLKYMRDRILRTNEESEPCWDERRLKCTENCVMPTRNIESEVDKLDQGKISSLYSAGSWF